MAMMKSMSLFVTVFTLCVGFAFTATARDDDMMMHGDMMMEEGVMVPMVEMPAGMSKNDIPEGMMMMMDTPEGRKAFVPWYLTKAFSSAKKMMQRDSMDGVMVQMEDGSYAFLPWYLSPQHADMLMHEGGDMKMMESDGMRFVVVPWYRQQN